MNVDPVNEEKESRFCDIVGFSYEAPIPFVRPWFELCNLPKSYESQHDNTRLTIGSPKGKRYAY